MPIAVDDMKMLRAYVRGVVGKAEHHAQNVDQIILALAGAVILRKDSSPLRVRAGPGGKLGRALQFTSSKNRTYALSYNHATKAIDLKRNNFQGDVLHSFTNKTKLAEVSVAFAKL